MRPLFSVFTPTFNRKEMLRGVYDSLRAQTLRDFEWVVVDDGSSDGTGDLVKMWQGEANFPIRYFYQRNQGKHVAFNRGVRAAEGYFFLPLDDDDRCADNAMERFKFHWERIPTDERDRFASLSCLSGRNGKVVGAMYPQPVTDAPSFRRQWRLRSGGERWGITRTDLLRECPFPEFPGERYVPEALVWNRVAIHYAGRFVAEVLRHYNKTEGGVTANLSKILAQSARGSSLYYRELLGYPVPFGTKLRAAVNYCRFSFHACRGTGRMFGMSSATVVTLLGLLPAYLFYRWGQSTFRKRKRDPRDSFVQHGSLGQG